VELIRFDSSLATFNNGFVTLDSGTVKFVEGKYGKALEGDGANSYSLTSHVFPDTLRSSATVSIWV